eukprot:scaffold119128_cov25-Tisochrysis_lutea.AAC.1
MPRCARKGAHRRAGKAAGLCLGCGDDGPIRHSPFEGATEAEARRATKSGKRFPPHEATRQQARAQRGAKFASSLAEGPLVARGSWLWGQAASSEHVESRVARGLWLWDVVTMGPHSRARFPTPQSSERGWGAR